MSYAISLVIINWCRFRYKGAYNRWLTLLLTPYLLLIRLFWGYRLSWFICKRNRDWGNLCNLNWEWCNLCSLNWDRSNLCSLNWDRSNLSNLNRRSLCCLVGGRLTYLYLFRLCWGKLRSLNLTHLNCLNWGHYLSLSLSNLHSLSCRCC